ncbi:DUF2339 domain-containing protein [Marinobacter sp. F4218]|uniref:DUF2339 domain-containing protein n=1 Tax=Marinobacter sp. F4218 TaxID=2862868 RepID=UPI001C62CAD7|nr:DUF2339 domain-containing protein [Marinobacter sp. F4218]MBW7470770.1 DUF2339 domain-containing protein [Marinobacter sp. F4218]
MEVVLILLTVGVLILVPVGSLLGVLAFRQRREQASRLDSLAKELFELRQEVARLRDQAGEQPGQAPALSLDEPETSEAAPQAPAFEPAAPGRDAEQWSEPRTPSPLVQALKDNWMVWLGGLSVALAGIFMVSHSINAGLIGPLQQLVLALISGLALHLGAEVLRRRHMGTDQVFAALAGGGSITLYAALLAGVHHFGFISAMTGLVGLAFVSLVTMALALVHGPLLAIMGLSGAYLVPLLIGGDEGSVAFVLSYSFLITLSSLLLMRYVFRDWLWYATLAGAMLWWLLGGSAEPVGASIPWYLAGLVVAFASLRANHQVEEHRLWQAFLPLLLAWGFSIAVQSEASPVFWSWLLILPATALIPQSRGAFWYLPWASVVISAVGWLVYRGSAGPDTVYLMPVPELQQGGFLAYLVAAAILTVGAGLWQWVRHNDQRRWASLTLLSPLVWLVLGWLLLHGYETSAVWAVMTLSVGAIYGVLAWQMESRESFRSGVVWAVLAAHISYSLAAVMIVREASLTLALSVQFVSLTWLARRFQMPELYLLLKVALALVVARLTFNPWLQSYAADVHWSLWTYGGATLMAGTATRLSVKGHSIRPWLEGATLHLLVLFLGTELRYWLYDGDIFAREYSLTEAAINTLLWGSLSVTYMVRATASQSLAWLYRLFARILLALAGLSYASLLTVLNPWWGGSNIGDTPVFNLLLPAYGGPVILALLISRFPALVPRFWALCVAAAGFLQFTVLEIRQLWQGSEMAVAFGMSEGELYSYSVIGMLYAIATIIHSTRRASPLLYKTGMALLGIVIAKIFLIDMAGLQGLWRVAAFMGLGLALLGLAWMYRNVQRTPEHSGQAGSHP